MRQIRDPAFRIWVPGSPRAAGKNRGARSRYVEQIRKAASEVVSHPTKSPRIDIEVFFHAETSLRADVDNVIKPILDALIGVVYEDDRQVRSARVTALPKGEPFRSSGSGDVFTRLMKTEPKEFLINVYGGLFTPGPYPAQQGVVADRRVTASFSCGRRWPPAAQRLVVRWVPHVFCTERQWNGQAQWLVSCLRGSLNKSPGYGSLGKACHPEPFAPCHPEHIRFAQCRLREGSSPAQGELREGSQVA